MENTTKQKYSIRNSKLYYGEDECTPEFGNQAQIDCIKRHAEWLNQLEHGQPCDIDIEKTFTASFRIKCKCEQNIYFEIEVDDEDDIDNEFIGKKKKCRKCHTEFIIAKNYDDDLDTDLIAKIVK